MQKCDEMVFQLFTYELGEVAGKMVVRKLNDGEKYVRFVQSDMSDENALVSKLFEADVIPQDTDGEYLVDNDAVDIIYIDKNGQPFCELRRIIAH